MRSVTAAGPAPRLPANPPAAEVEVRAPQADAPAHSPGKGH